MKKTFENPTILSVTTENFSQVIFKRNDLSRRELNLLRGAIDHFLSKRIRLLEVYPKEVLALSEKFPEIWLDGSRYCLVYDKKEDKEEKEGFLGLCEVETSAVAETNTKAASKVAVFLSNMQLAGTSLAQRLTPVLQSNL
jgi:hypothetical protein